MHIHDQILEFLKTTGPTLPARVAKNAKTDILLASAHLADLASQSKVKLTKLKIGGSPLYYLAGQEEQLYQFAAGNMNPKDFRVLEKLKGQKVLREASLDTLSKVAVRSLQDFAIPLHVRTEKGTELFWKWHLLSEEETNQRIANIFRGDLQQAGEVVAKEVEVKQAEEKVEDKEELKPEIEVESLPTELEVKVTEPEVVKKEEEKPVTEKKEKVERKRVKQKKLSEELPEKKPLPKKEKKVRKKRAKVPDLFLPQIKEFFKGMEIKIEQKELVRKNAEMNFLLKVPSAVGKMVYFCKAKSKNKCDEKDLSAAYMEAQIKKLPLLFLYTKEINKKAQKMLESGAFENAIVKKIE